MPHADAGLSDHFTTYLAKRGLNPALARANGWYPATIDGVPRIVMPATNTTGEVYWQARSINWITPMWIEPRYISPQVPRDDSVIIVWPRFDWSERPRYAEVVIVEGPMDALAVGEVGACAVALMGNRPPESVWPHIAQMFTGKSFVIVADGDSPDAAAGWMMKLTALGKRARVVIPLPFKDVASIPLEEREGVLGL